MRCTNASFGRNSKSLPHEETKLFTKARVLIKRLLKSLTRPPTLSWHISKYNNSSTSTADFLEGRLCEIGAARLMPGHPKMQTARITDPLASLLPEFRAVMGWPADLIGSSC